MWMSKHSVEGLFLYAKIDKFFRLVKTEETFDIENYNR